MLTESAIDPEVARERGYLALMRPRVNYDNSPIPGLNARDALKRLGFPSWSVREDYYFPGLWLPGWDVRGRRFSGQWKPKNPVSNRDGKAMKYTGAKGATMRLDVHPRWTRDPDPDGRAVDAVPVLRDVSRELWITEGIKKADALTSQGVCTVTLFGVYNWRNALGTLGEWEEIPLKGRRVTVCFDADALTKPTVLAAMTRLGRWLRSKGASVLYVVPPGGPKGVDDYFAAGGTLKALERARQAKPYAEPATEDTFTDARLAEIIAADVLDGAYCWTTGLGWLAWDGKRWATVPDAAVTEAVRQYVITRYVEALDDEKQRAASGESADRRAVDGWHKAQRAQRIADVIKLARGIAGVLRDAAEFDTDPDLLNTPSGVVDLRTGETFDHDPDLMITKITGVGYRPGAESPALKAALEAVPADALEWFQLRIGQAATGHQADDGRMLLLTGGGRNGKTAIMGAIFRALGGHEFGHGYATKVPNTLLLKGKSLGSATPEKMTLRGTRLAYMEETPEEGYLDSTVVKDLLDAEAIEGRKLYKDTVTWKPTHSIFLNTNHAPTVTDTGDGAWRRLARVDFPIRYRLNGDPIERETDRVGDPRLKAKLAATEALEAVLAWVVAGAIRWYDNGRSLATDSGDPASVRASLERWREASDDILRYLRERCAFDPARWVPSDELYREFAEWMKANGHRVPSSKEFLKRLKDHSALPPYVEAKQVRASRAGVSRAESPWLAERKPLPEKPRAVIGLAFLTD
ncbi:phage/plasmid primase, P4 family [Micromonospora sp. RP3T]|uniref:phage/plasmid primase, P4 family n=1 Tax=Micromonospora sp. RP3T TaxID=2135446 RepID=UPI003D74A2AB